MRRRTQQPATPVSTTAAVGGSSTSTAAAPQLAAAPAATCTGRRVLHSPGPRGANPSVSQRALTASVAIRLAHALGAFVASRETRSRGGRCARRGGGSGGRRFVDRLEPRRVGVDGVRRL